MHMLQVDQVFVYRSMLYTIDMHGISVTIIVNANIQYSIIYITVQVINYMYVGGMVQ